MVSYAIHPDGFDLQKQIQKVIKLLCNHCSANRNRTECYLCSNILATNPLWSSSATSD